MFVFFRCDARQRQSIKPNVQNTTCMIFIRKLIGFERARLLKGLFRRSERALTSSNKNVQRKHMGLEALEDNFVYLQVPL